jgi:hypothetical protein
VCLALHLKPKRALCKHARAGAKRSELSMTPSELTPDAIGTRSGGTRYTPASGHFQFHFHDVLARTALINRLLRNARPFRSSN